MKKFYVTKDVDGVLSGRVIEAETKEQAEKIGRETIPNFNPCSKSTPVVYAQVW